MAWWNPFDWARQATENALQDIFLHMILPVILVLFAIATLIFAPMRLRWKFLLVVIFLVAAAWLWGLIPWVS